MRLIPYTYRSGSHANRSAHTGQKVMLMAIRREVMKSQSITVRGGADCTALPWGNGLYCKLKLKREEEELTIRSKYLNKYSKR